MTYAYNLLGNAGAVLRYRAATATYTSVTTLTDFDLFEDAIGAGDCLYFSSGAGVGNFADVQVTVGTPIAATGLVLAWEYQLANVTWATLTVVDPSSGFTVAGTHRITFTPPLDWAYQYWSGFKPLGLQPYLFVRCRVVSVTSSTEGGRHTTNRVQVGDNAVHFQGGSAGSRNTMAGAYAASVAGGWGVITRVGNALPEYHLNAHLVMDAASYNDFTSEMVGLVGFGNRFVLTGGDTNFGRGSGTSRAYYGPRFANGWTMNGGTMFAIKAGATPAFGVSYTTRMLAGSWTGGATIQVQAGTYVGMDLQGVGFGLDSAPKITWPASGLVLVACRIQASQRYGVVPASLPAAHTLYWTSNSYQSPFFDGGQVLYELDGFLDGYCHFRGTGGQVNGRLRDCAGAELLTTVDHYHSSLPSGYLNVEWSLWLTVLGSTGAPLQGATVVIKDVDGTTVYSGTTDANGQVPIQYLVQKQLWDDHAGSYWGPNNRITTLTPHTVTITAAGYADRTLTLTMDRGRVEVEQMALATPPGLPRTRVVGGS